MNQSDRIVMKFFFLFLLVLISNAFAKPCGISGSIEERIKDCSQSKGNFVVVAITDPD
jgi:hypothetical protein